MNESLKDKSEKWILNPHGIKVCLPAYIANELVTTKLGFSFTTPDDTPVVKSYPVSKDMTEEGASARKAASAVVAEEEQEGDPEGKVEMEVTPLTKNYTMKELHKLASNQGIQSFGKSKATLMNLLGL